MKYTLEFKLECVDKYKKGIHIETPGKTRNQRKSFMNHVREWVHLFDDLGIDGLRHSGTNKEWTKEERFELVAKVLAGNSVTSVARKAHIPDGMLFQWVRKYREKGIDGLECRKTGRPPKVPTMPKKKKVKLAPSEKEELTILRARNEYLEAENIYLKKLEALVIKREAAHPKAKKQKSLKK